MIGAPAVIRRKDKRVVCIEALRIIPIAVSTRKGCVQTQRVLNFLRRQDK